MLSGRPLPHSGLSPVRPTARPRPRAGNMPHSNSSNTFAALADLTLEDEQRLQGSSRPSADSSTAEASTSSTPTAAAADGASNGDAAHPAAAAGGTAPAAPGASKPGGSKGRFKDPLVWIDLEMTGLDIEKDTILELACIVTNGDLDLMIEGPEIVIHHSDEVLNNMNAWCIEHHGKSGLTQKSRDSTVSMAEAEEQLLEFIAAHTPYQSAQLAGNSVHVDRLFLMKYMPRVVEHLHYRIVDVSTVGELCRRWSPKVGRHAPKKEKKHTAMSDIRESLRELTYYKRKLFNNKS